MKRDVTEESFSAALPTLLLCRKAGGVLTGVGATLDAVRSKTAIAVVTARDASERTKKQIADKCAFYSVDLFEADVTAEKLGGLLGCGGLCAAAAVTRKGPYGPLSEKLSK